MKVHLDEVHLHFDLKNGVTVFVIELLDMGKIAIL